MLAHETTSDDNLTAELHPFAFSSGSKGPDEFRETPFVFVPNLIAKVADTLTQHERYKSNCKLKLHTLHQIIIDHQPG